MVAENFTQETYPVALVLPGGKHSRTFFQIPQLIPSTLEITDRSHAGYGARDAAKKRRAESYQDRATRTGQLLVGSLKICSRVHTSINILAGLSRVSLIRFK